MADYLSNLAAGLGEASGFLRPRQASLFEPTDANRGPVAAGEPAAPELNVFEESDGEPRRPRVAPESISERPARPEGDAVAFRESGKALKANERQQRSEGQTAPRETDHRESRRDADPIVRATLAPKSAMPPFTEVVEKIEKRPVERSEERHPEDSSSFDEPKGLAPRPEAGIPNIELRPPPASIFQPPSSLERPMAPRAAVQDEPGRKQNKPAEPTIQITIGRVEVRATQDAEPRGRKSPETSPVMTLDEYLRKRAK